MECSDINFMRFWIIYTQGEHKIFLWYKPKYHTEKYANEFHEQFVNQIYENFLGDLEHQNSKL